MKDRYEVGDLLGRGGMGQVHSGRHRSGHLVAIKRVRKTLMSDPVLSDRLANEARVLYRVRHPNVVRALDSGHDTDGAPFLVMDRAYGEPLDAVLAKGRLSLARVAHIAAQVLSGLAAIHDAGVVHADVKSSNVMIDENDHVVIIDFGLARTMSRIDNRTIIAGTPSFMAPEVIGGATPTTAADIYAAGAILYEMLTGTRPFVGPSQIVLIRQLADTVEPPSQRAPDAAISPQIDAVVLRALEREPGARFASARDLAAAFTDALRAVTPAEESLPELIELTAAQNFWGDDEDTATTRFAGPTQVEPDTVITIALDRVREMIDAKQISRAIDDLEKTLGSLRAADENEDVTPSVWRLQSVLAALYHHIGRHETAARFARVAVQYAARTQSEGAKLRTRELLARVGTPRTRFARGSKPIKDERGPRKG